MMILAVIPGCRKEGGQITATTISVYLNESNCSIFEKISSGALREHQIIILESAPLFAFAQASKADANLIRFFVEEYMQQDGLLSSEQKGQLTELQHKHLSWNQMTLATQKFMTDLVFKGCTE